MNSGSFGICDEVNHVLKTVKNLHEIKLGISKLLPTLRYVSCQVDKKGRIKKLFSAMRMKAVVDALNIALHIPK